ncbi:Major Facilitator Superfamily [Aspergillus sclerotialis]|uniref:Major Facilitator Superfamily n=1 Tax=Aspergillus sclerotialis TaxID=2070753 RepID=A0A3A2ZYP5_9EURO|nr:Major Facilitator Superfamily [Aspergillus sclerotialis]
MVVYSWATASDEVMADLSIHYTYMLLLDDSHDDPAASMESFYDNMLAGIPQEHPWWRMVNEQFPQVLRHYGPYCGLNMIRSTTDCTYISSAPSGAQVTDYLACKVFKGCWVEQHNFMGFPGSFDYPTFLRRLNGLGHCVGGSIFPKERFDEKELFTEITTAIAQMENLVFVNDVLSFYKEFDVPRDQTSLINNYARCNDITLQEALGKVTEDTIVDSVQLLSVFRDKDPRILHTLRAFLQGYVTWHLCDPRYRLQELHSLTKELTGDSIKLQNYLQSAKEVGSVDPKEWAYPSVASLAAKYMIDSTPVAVANSTDEAVECCGLKSYETRKRLQETTSYTFSSFPLLHNRDANASIPNLVHAAWAVSIAQETNANSVTFAISASGLHPIPKLVRMNGNLSKTLLSRTKGTQDDTFDQKTIPSIENGDIALRLATELDADCEMRPELERRMRRKADFILLPLVSCTATLSFLDKVSNNFANNYGLSTALDMNGDQFSWSASIFYFAFLVWQPAVSYMTQHFPIGKVVSINCICWGLILLGQGFVKNYAGFIVLRFFQGIFEACVLPSFVLMCSIWWTREEQSLRAAFWFNSVAGVFGGLFAYAIGQLNVQPGFYRYQYLYITYGSFTTAWGVMLLFALPDSPVNAWFLNHEERLAAVSRAKRNQTGMLNRHFKWEQLVEALLDPKTWFFFFFAFISNVVNGGLDAFSTTIIRGFGFSFLNTTLLSMPWGCIATIANIIVGLCISFTSGKRLFYMAAVVLIPLAGAIIKFSLINGPRGAALFGFYLTGAYNAAYVMLLALVSSNTAGTTKKVVVNALVWIAYCAGKSVAIPQSQQHRPQAGQ